MGNFKEATKNLERAVELRPEDPVLNDHLGDALWREGHKKQAKGMWVWALSLNPEPADAEKIKRKISNGLEQAEVARQSTTVVAALPPGAQAVGKPPGELIADQKKLARALQTELKRVGCDPVAIDGHWGANAIDALRAFNRAAKTALSIDAPTEDALRTVAGMQGRICALTCGAREKVQDGRCVAIVKPERTRPNVKEEQRGAAKGGAETKGLGTCFGHNWVGGGAPALRPCTGAPGEKRAY
jgi:hypothetical protein